MENYELCKECKIELRATKNPRLRPTSCADCKITKYNYKLNQLHLECSELSQEEDGFFEDVAYDPEEGIMMKTKPTHNSGIQSSLG